MRWGHRRMDGNNLAYCYRRFFFFCASHSPKKSNKISFEKEKRRERSTDRVTVRLTSARRLTTILIFVYQPVCFSAVFLLPFAFSTKSHRFCFVFVFRRFHSNVSCAWFDSAFFFSRSSLSPSYSCTGTFIRFAFCRNESDAPQFPGWTTTHWKCVLNSRTTNEMMWLACRETFCWQTVWRHSFDFFLWLFARFDSLNWWP